jgi:dephospho-CoA kinase
VRVVGLTGGIGSGKSSVARLLAKLGASVIDADQISREVVEPGRPALRKIVDRFGPEVLDSNGRLDRKRLAQIVFADEAARADLNAIVHPAVAERTQEEIAARAAQGAKLVVYDVPLLYETGLERAFPWVIVVHVPPEVQRRRIEARDLLSPDEIEARIRAQMPLAEKMKRATYLVDNSGTLEETEEIVKALYEKLMAGE